MLMKLTSQALVFGAVGQKPFMIAEPLPRDRTPEEGLRVRRIDAQRGVVVFDGPR
jgi:hypothetical protein